MNSSEMETRRSPISLLEQLSVATAPLWSAAAERSADAAFAPGPKRCRASLATALNNNRARSGVLQQAPLAIAALCLVAFGPALLADTWYVRTCGSDAADGRTPQTAFKTVSQAAGVINHGDALVIGPGTHKGSSLMAERFSADGSAMSITGDESGQITGDPAGAVVLVAARPTQAALTFHRFRNLNLSGLTFRGPGQGLKLDQCIDVTVQRCTFDGLSRAAVIGACQDTLVQSCVLSRNILGLFIQGSARTRVDHITLAGSTSAGLVALGCGAGELRNSVLTANNSNLVLDPLSAKSWASDYNVISGTTGPWGEAPAVANIHEWASASGQERHSVYVAPAFADPDRYDLHVSANVTWPGGLPGMSVAAAGANEALRDREGKTFRVRGAAACAGAYDYPDPTPAAGWAKLPARIDGREPRQSAGIYRENGELIRTLLADAAGVTELYWDGLDDQGQVVPAGKYMAKVLSHDVRVLDDGAVGDNGNPMGVYNCDNAVRVCAMSDGGFVLVTPYDEAGFPLRRYSSTGQPVQATGLAEGGFTALCSVGDDDMYAILGKGGGAKLIHLVLPGERAIMANGAEFYPLLTAEEKDAAVLGLAVAGEKAYVSVGGLNVVRVIELATGRTKADWKVEKVGDIAAAGETLWVTSGKDIVALGADGTPGKRIASGLEAPRYLAASRERLAAVDNVAARLAILGTDGRAIRTSGRTRSAGEFTPVGPDAMRDPRGLCFLADGRLVVTEQARVRVLFPDQGKISQDILSNFMDVMVVHPTRPEYGYCYLGVFKADPRTGAWQWLVEEPRGMTARDANGAEQPFSYGSPSTRVVLGGRPFIVYHGGGVRMFDVSDPLKPRLAFESRHPAVAGGAYDTISFTRDGSVIGGVAGPDGYTLAFNKVPFKGLDAANNPVFDFEKTTKFGPMKDPSPRGMSCIRALSVDSGKDDIYYGAVTRLYNKMVPAWGADGTGVGKSAASGTPLWFALSSGGNYMSLSAISDGRHTFVLAGKSFGGQIDLFDDDGLRLTTGNWSWPCNYSIGFVDLRYGVNAYLRPDGKVGAYIEDDSIGRFARCRIDGAETIRKTSTALDWQPIGAAAGGPPNATMVRAKGLEKVQVIPKVALLKADGDWPAWEKARIAPQIIALPTVSFRHCTLPDDLWQTFSLGTAIGALAHDGKNLYACFLVCDQPQRFDAEMPGAMFSTDSVELWVEQDQFGLGLIKDGSAHLFKYRFHDRQGKPYAANYPLSDENIWGRKLDDVSAHPLGKQLAEITGVSLRGRKGYVVMGRIPMAEVKLVGGVAGRAGTDVLDMTGKGGEVIRIAVAFSGNLAWGHSQDYKVAWPAGMMFSDPTRSSSFVLGE